MGWQPYNYKLWTSFMMSKQPKPSKPRFTYRTVNGQRIKFFYYNGQWRNYNDYWTQYVQYNYVIEQVINGQTTKMMFYNGKWVPFNARVWNQYMIEVTPKPQLPRIAYRKINGQRVKAFYYNGQWRNYAQYWTQWLQYNYRITKVVNGRQTTYMYYNGKWQLYNAKTWSHFLVSHSPAPSTPKISYRTVNGRRTKFFYYQGQWRNYRDYWSQYLQYTYIVTRQIGNQQVQLMYYNGKWRPYNASASEAARSTSSTAVAGKNIATTFTCSTSRTL